MKTTVRQFSSSVMIDAFVFVVQAPTLKKAVRIVNNHACVLTVNHSGSYEVVPVFDLIAQHQKTTEQQIFEVWNELQDCANKFDLDGVAHYVECLYNLHLDNKLEDQ